MTVINNNIKALIASQALQMAKRGPTASVSQLPSAWETSNVETNTAIDNAYLSAQAKGTGRSSNTQVISARTMQIEINSAPGITDLLIRLRDLAKQTITAIRHLGSTEVPDSECTKRLEAVISELDASSCDFLDRIGPTKLPCSNSSTATVETGSDSDSTPIAQYAHSTSEQARAQVEQHAGKDLLTQANQRPAFVMALLH